MVSVPVGLLAVPGARVPPFWIVVSAPPQLDPTFGEANRGGDADQLVKPVGIDVVVGNHDRFGDMTSLYLGDHLVGKLLDVRLRIERVEPDLAAP